ncbi:MAG: DedA family protein [Candidatus Ranarchaeia archaeon]
MTIFTALATMIVEWIQSIGWPGVLGGILLESLIAPIPSPLIPMAAGAILPPQNQPLLQIMLFIFIYIGLVGAFGVTIGSLLMYTIGYYGGRSLITRFQSWLGVTWEEVEGFGNKLENQSKAGPLIFTLRAIPIIPLSIISLASGSIRIEYKSFFTWTFIGGIPRCFALGVLGWLFAESFGGISNILDNIENLTLIFIVLIVVVYFTVKKVRDRQVQRYLEGSVT